MVRSEFWLYKYSARPGLKAAAQIDGFSSVLISQSGFSFLRER